MIAEDHGYNGFAVRAQAKGTMFRQYVSITHYGPSDAWIIAVRLMNDLRAVLNNRQNWRGGALTKKALKQITSCGFKVQAAPKK